ncbi:MAG: hypothetical protein WCW52_01225 [Elusimicrobiales bacterium]|jgi:hypothetical protein
MIKRIKSCFGIFAITAFLCTALLLFKGAIFSPGLISGGDWGFPLTLAQIRKLAEISGSTWFFNGFLQFRNINTIGCFFYSAWAGLAPLGINGGIFGKIFLIFIFVISGYSAYSLLRTLKVECLPAIFGGLVLITTPVFFNYSLMGWTFVLLAAGVFPLIIKYFIRAVENNDWGSVVLVALLYWVASFQSQAVVWVPLLFILLAPILIGSLKELAQYSIKALGIFLLFGLLSQYFLLHIFMIPDTAASGSSLINTTDTLGTMAFFYPLNIMRGFGGLFNNQFETIVSGSGFEFFNFILPLMAVAAFFSKTPKKILFSLFLISQFPFGMWILSHYRDVLAHIPFANVIRDFPRFTVFSAVGYSLLAGISLDSLLKKDRKSARGLALICVFIWLISLSPWWTGGASDWVRSSGPDIRLRNNVFSEEYFKAENLLEKDKRDSRGIYLPFGSYAQFTDNVKFNGGFNSFADIFAFDSPIPGSLAPNSRELGDNDYETAVVSALREGNIYRLALTHNLKYIILRKNMVSGMNMRKAVKECEKYFIPYYAGRKMAIYIVNDSLPHFYTPLSVVRSDTATEFFAAEAAKSHPRQRLLVLPEHVMDFLQLSVASTATVEYRKIVPTKYRVRIHGAQAELPLVFAESFHAGWKAYPRRMSASPTSVEALKEYRILDGNSGEQADTQELSEYLGEGLVTSLGDLKNKSFSHRVWQNGADKLGYIENYKIGYISKKIGGTIQNDNLPSGTVWETWRGPALSEQNHFKANGYANAWIIKAAEICSTNEKICRQNSDGTYDLELIVEFEPQKYFYIGLAISLLTLFWCLFFIYSRRGGVFPAHRPADVEKETVHESK